MTDPVIAVERASKRYVKYDDTPMLVSRALKLRTRTARSELWAVRDADFSVERGSCLGVIGRNGSGKSTLLRMLAGVTAPTKGRVAVQGRIAPLIAVGVGFHPELTGRENVYVSGTILGLARAEIDRRFDEIVDFAEIERFIDTPVKFYSSGMFVRLGFAVSVLADPDVLLVDEVLAVGDIAFQLKCMDRMMEIQQAGTTIVVVSHNLNAIRRMCDRTLLLHDGVTRHDGDTPDAIALFHDLLSEQREVDDPDEIQTHAGLQVLQRGDIESFELYGQNGPTGRITAGEPVRLSLQVRFFEAVDDCVIGVTMYNQAGIQVYGDSSDWSNKLRFNAGSAVRFDVHLQPHLAGGSYSVQIGVANKQGALLTKVPRPLSFYVEGRSAVNGIADLEGRFSVEVDEHAPPITARHVDAPEVPDLVPVGGGSSSGGPMPEDADSSERSSGSAPASRLRALDLARAAGVALIVGGIGFLLSRTSYDNYDGNIMGQVATGILERQSVKVQFDAYQLNSPYSFYGLLMSLLMLPGIGLAKLIGSPVAAGAMATNAWLLAVLAVVVYAWCRVRRCEPGESVFVALLAALGSGLLWFASTGFAEVALAISIAAGMLGLSAMRAGRSWGPVVVGIATGAAVLARDDSLVLVLPWLVGGALLVADARATALRRIAAGGAPFALLWTAYNAVRFGAPWVSGYSGVVKFNHSIIDGVVGLVASPGRGVLLFAPVIVVAIVGFRLSWRGERALTVVAIGLLVGRIVFYAPHWGWYSGGGFGPRYVLGAMPVLALGLMEAVRQRHRFPSPVRLLGVAIALASIGIGVVGGAVDYESSSLQQGLRNEPGFVLPTGSRDAFLDFVQDPATQRVVDHHMFDWGEMPIADEVRSFVRRDNIVSAALRRPVDRLRLVIAVLLMGSGAGLLMLARWRRSALPAAE